MQIPVIEEQVARKFLNDIEFKVYQLMLKEQEKGELDGKGMEPISE